MTHDHATRVVVSLVPEIEKRGAEAVLTGYAEEHNLPPTQLEKLGHVYNTLRTLSHIDNADVSARGASVPILDVPELVVGYATGLGKEKSAGRSPISVSSHDPAVVDLNRALRLEVSPPAPKMQKAAAAVRVFDNVSSSAMADALLELEMDLRADMSKLAGEIISGCPRADHFTCDVSTAEREALYHVRPHMAKAAGEFLVKFAAPHRLSVLRHDYSEQLAKRAYAVEHELGEKFAELAKAVSTYDVVVKMAAGNPSPGTPPAEDGADHSDLPSIPSMMGNRGSAAVEEEDPEMPTDEEMREAVEGLHSHPTSAEPAAGSAPKVDDEHASGKGEDKRGGEPAGKGKDSDPGKSDGGFLSAAGSAAAAPFKMVGGAIQGAASSAQDLLHSVISKSTDNKTQRSVDLDVHDIRRAMNVRRMIGTDPVLREADPRDVLEIYNSVAELNPELAGNIPALRLILREAVSYEGLTLDSQKILSEIGRNRAQAEDISRDNDKQRYAISKDTAAAGLAGKGKGNPA